MANWEVLKSPSQCRVVKRLKSARALTAFAALDSCVETESYQGQSEWLVIWGASASFQAEAMAAHRANGGNVLCLDLGYFGTHTTRMSINAPHPQHLMRYATGRRDGFTVRELDDIYYKPSGHLLIAGMGPKSRHGLGLSGPSWEREQVRKLSEAYPGRRIMYRPKPKQREVIDGAIDASEGSIDWALRGCGLVVVHHSNVAIDCVLHGVPCVAYDGAGAFAYNQLVDSPVERLLGAARCNFLHRVAWFNWRHEEFEQMRNFAIELSSVSK